jgi:hypothetical protein
MYILYVIALFQKCHNLRDVPCSQILYDAAFADSIFTLVHHYERIIDFVGILAKMEDATLGNDGKWTMSPNNDATYGALKDFLMWF